MGGQLTLWHFQIFIFHKATSLVIVQLSLNKATRQLSIWIRTKPLLNIYVEFVLKLLLI